MKITVVGTGYVGLVTGTCLADMGNVVTCNDIDPEKIAFLQSGGIPIYEPGLKELVHRNARDGRLTFTTDLSESVPTSEVCFIAVGTPSDEDGSADRRYVVAAARAIAQAMQGPLVVAVKSTVPVGTCDMVCAEMQEVLDARGVDYVVDVVSNPEFLKEGKAVQDFSHPDRIVIGVESELAGKVMQSLYADFVRNGHPLLLMGRRSSEMTKYAANAMLATRISLMNEIARICDNVGADIMSVRSGIGTDNRIGPRFLYAGIGYGGSCFPKDVKALAQLALESDSTSNLLDAVEQVNRQQKLILANRVIEHFGGEVRGKRFAIWGIAFKANTDDIREAPALAIIKRLTYAGAHVCATDPEAMDNAKKTFAGNNRVSFADDIYAASEGVDAIILATEWGAFRNPDFNRLLAKMNSPVFFDGRNQFDPDEMVARGFVYSGIGRGGTRGL
jgi:UDPglucose 6-dehydrogenase